MFASSLFIRIMTCLWNGPLVIILIFSLDLSWLLIIFCTILIFLFWSLGKTFLIFNISLVILVGLVCLADICTYDLGSWLTSCCFLKYFDILLTFLANFARMGEERVEIQEEWDTLDSLALMASFTTCGLNFDLMLFLKEWLVLSTNELFYWDE